jgi:hypothetical protein
MISTASALLHYHRTLKAVILSSWLIHTAKTSGTTKNLVLLLFVRYTFLLQSSVVQLCSLKGQKRESCHGLFKVLSHNLRGGTEENHKNPVIISSILAKI